MKLIIEVTDKMIISAQCGDYEALNYIISKYSKLAFYYSYNKLGNKFDAEDCAQECINKIVMNLHLYQIGPISFNTWAVSIIRNHIISYYRLNRNYIENEEKDEEFVFNYLEDSKYSDKNLVLIEAERLLGKEVYEILLLKIGYGWTYDELSSHFNIPATSLRRICDDALKKLKKSYAKEGGKK